MNRRPYYGRPQDVKERTMKKSFAALDPDIASRYEDLDDEDNSTIRYRGGTSRGGGDRLAGRIAPLLPKKMLNMIEGHINRKERSIMRTAAPGSKQREPIYIITVKNASRSGKNHILKLLSENVDSFMPISPRIDENGDLTFFVLTEDDASAVAVMSKRITDKHNPSMKYVIYKNRKPAPFDPLSNATKQVIEEILKTRYNQFTNSLDLSNFQNDPMFEKTRETPRGLFHNNVMVAIADYVAKNFSSIRGIRLNNNNLRALDYVSTLVYAAPNVVELDLSNNALSRIDELSKLSGWQLESVHFENNEFSMQFHHNLAAYTSAVHEHFPRVSYLDGVGVNVALSAETSTSASVPIPKFKVGFAPDESLRKMIENFLVEYYGFYDGLNGEQTRQQLINAYDPNATFSYAYCCLPDTQFIERGDNDLYSTYIRSSHNIMSQQKWQNYRDRLLFRGPMDIAVALSKLPPTEHIKQSFLLDFNLASNSMVVITLHGIFRDGKENVGAEARSAKFKLFLRQFVIIPKAEGLAIISDTLQITPISTQRMEHYNNQLKNAVGQVAAREMDGMAPPPPSPQVQELAMPSSSLVIKQETIAANEQHIVRAEMVKQFCISTRMKPEWSEKCLQDCSWNWDDAQKAFAQIRAQIPPEAFVPI